ncbi:MAG: hypothetical protein IT208_10550 [Chthonomonadales bacterium]|nr:hypothetical protein [Chthonomonadales bacterium]
MVQRTTGIGGAPESATQEASAVAAEARSRTVPAHVRAREEAEPIRTVVMQALTQAPHVDAVTVQLRYASRKATPERLDMLV